MESENVGLIAGAWLFLGCICHASNTTHGMGHSQVVRCWYLVVLVLQNIFYNKNVTMLKIICFYSTMISLDMIRI